MQEIRLSVIQFHNWKERFIKGGSQKDVDDLKRFVGDQALVIAGLKNQQGEMRMIVEDLRDRIPIARISRATNTTRSTTYSLDSLPRKGKEGRIRKLIKIAFVVTEKRGFPLFHRAYGRNISNRVIMDDLVKGLWIRGYIEIIVYSGIFELKRIKSLLKLSFTMICGLKKTPDLKRIIDGIDRNEIYTKAHMVTLKNTKVYCSTVDYMSGKLVIVYNPALEFQKKSHYYEHFSDESIAKYLGYSLIYHNTDLTTQEVVRKYYDKDSVERAFKQLKGVLDLRSVRMWLKSHIEGHVRVCYLAYAILSYLNYILESKEISGSEALDILRTGYRVYLEDAKTGFKWESMVSLSAIQKEIMNVVIKNT